MDQVRICFILHGQRCPRHLPSRLLACFAPHFQVDIHITTSSLETLGAACRAVEQGCDYLVAVGGDGTINEMVNGVMQAALPQRERVILGVLPYGTGNDFARSLGSDGAIHSLQRAIQQGNNRVLDLGCVHYHAASGQPQQRYFANIAALGISAAVIERVKALPRWLPAALAYGWGTVLSLLSLRACRFQLRIDQQPAQSETLIELCLANGRYFGGGMGVAPEASLDDGLLDLVMIRGASPALFLRFLPQLRQARRIQHPRISYQRCRQIEIVAASPACVFEADGELLGAGPVTIEVVPAALRWLVSADD